jgi:hypothetical protein
MQAQAVKPNLPSLGIRVASLGVDPFEGGAIAWLLVEPGAVDLLDPAESGQVHMEEVGQVARARVRNEGPRPVVLRADSIVTGGRQTRVVERSAIVAPAATVLVSVRCVEKGRWSAEDPSSAGRFTYAGAAGRNMKIQLARQRDTMVRSTGRSGLNQQEVWREVSAELEATHVSSRTESYAPVVTELRAVHRARARALGVTPRPEANAALIIPDRGAAWVEAFPTSAALRLHAEELAADLLEAARSPQDAEGPSSVGQAIEQLLYAAVVGADAGGEREAGLLGEAYALQSARVCGSLLLHESRVAHLSAVIA